MIKTFIRRLSKNESLYGFPGFAIPDSGLVRDFLDDLVATGVCILDSSFDRSDYIAINPEAPAIPTVEECVAEFPWSRAENELAVYIAMCGELFDFHGSSYQKTMTALADVAAYGVDWDRSSPPNDDVWSEFAGTFAESEDSRAMLAMDLVVNYDDSQSQYFSVWDRSKSFGVDLPSITDIIKASSGLFLERS